MNSTMSPDKQRTESGFTLIEVMVVVAIISILAAIAYPSYTEYVNRGRRAQAQTALLEAAQFLQRFYASNGRYDVDINGAPVNLSDWNRVPRETDSPQTYTIAFAQNGGQNIASNTQFLLQATPVAVDKCGTFTIDQTGFKGLSGQTTGITVKDCWK
jgi:type IV pilus assembly protein PilE